MVFRRTGMRPIQIGRHCRMTDTQSRRRAVPEPEQDSLIAAAVVFVVLMPVRSAKWANLTRRLVRQGFRAYQVVVAPAAARRKLESEQFVPQESAPQDLLTVRAPAAVRRFLQDCTRPYWLPPAPCLAMAD